MADVDSGCIAGSLGGTTIKLPLRLASDTGQGVDAAETVVSDMEERDPSFDFDENIQGHKR